jgi:DNA mismatch repair protein MutS
MLFTTDNQTIEDLNIFGKRSGESVYALFNHTFTRGGADLLEEMFRFPLSDHEAINNRSSIIQYFTGIKTFPFDVELFDIVEQYLGNTDERTKLSETEDGIVKKLSNIILKDPNYKFVYKGVTAIIDILNSFQHFINGSQAVPLSPIKAEMKTITALLNDEVFALLIKENTKNKIPFAKVAGYDKALRFRHRETIRKILRHIYYLDVYISVAKIAAERGFNFPVALSKDQHIARLEGVYHPLLPKAVANNLDFSPEGNVVFLTGANMAGKSTFMKSLGIAMFLAHMGFPVPAAKMEFSVLDGIFTTINLPDNLGMGASHFYAEVLRLKKVAKELSLSKKLFIIFDELFRGTNVKDAQEATIAITKAFADKRQSMFVISTHIIEAGDVLKELRDNISFKYLPTRMHQNTPIYTYKLENGITADRHGMIIINNEGIIDILKSRKNKVS